MKKKVGLGIGFGLIMLISIMIVIMVSVSVNYKPVFASPDSITIRNEGGKEAFLTHEINTEIYDETMKLFEQSFTRSYLSAFFAGQTGNTADVIETKNIQTFNDYKITFGFTEKQTLTVNNVAKEQKYKKIIFEVKNSGTFVQLNLYFQQDANPLYYYVLTTYANQTELYKYLDTLVYMSN